MSKAAEKTRSTGCVDHAAVLLFPEVWPCGSRTLVCSLDVHLHNEVPVLILHVLEADIPEDAGIVDEHVDPAKGLDRRLDDLVSILNRVVVRDGLAAGGCDFVDDSVGRLETQ